MPYVKNTAGQFLYFYAFDADGNAKTGDDANLSGLISLDGGVWNALTNAISEDDYGWYLVELSQGETNCNLARVRIISNTDGVKVNPIVIHFTNYTETKAGYLDASIAARPVNPLLDDDVRLDNLDAKVSERATQADILSDATPFAGAFIDRTISEVEANIRGADGDDLKALSDQIGALDLVSTDDILAMVFEQNLSFRDFLRVVFAILAGFSSGGNTDTFRFRDAKNVKDRITFKLDKNGNRMFITMRLD